MAYFDCIVGGSGKGNTLVVTCADDLAGVTITCTNGTKTYTKNCPSTAPYEVTFYGLEAGTWTVSATVSGNTYTTTVVITDYEAELGGFSWRAWVDLSKNYTSSDFTDLDDLLSDETAIRELMTIHACVDYLAGIAEESADVETIIGNDLCAKWINLRDYALDTLYANEIIADYMDEADKYGYGEWVITDSTTTPPTWGPKGNVPVMTANNAPYGVASATREQSGYEAYKAFDDDPTTAWSPSSGTLPVAIAYQFVNPVCVRRVKYQNRNSSYDAHAKTFKVQGTNGGSDTWHDVSDVLTNPYCTNSAADNGKVSYYDIPNNDYYLYYRLYILTTNGGRTDVSQAGNIQFYGRELSVSVPTMTNNTTPYGEIINQNVVSNLGWYAFDNTNTRDMQMQNFSNGARVGFDFGHSVLIKFATITNLNASASSRAVKTYNFQSSDDGITWEDASETKTNTNTTANALIFAGEINTSNKVGRYFAFHPTEGQSATPNEIHLGQIRFYGKDYSEKEFEEGTTKKWLYDHGVELETMIEFHSDNSAYTTKGVNTITTKVDAVATRSASILCGVDLSDYSRLRTKIESVYSSYGNDANGPTLVVISTASPASTVENDAITQVNTPVQAPYNISLDVSSFNTSKYVGIRSRNVSSNQFIKIMSVNELWLE